MTTADREMGEIKRALPWHNFGRKAPKESSKAYAYVGTIPKVCRLLHVLATPREHSPTHINLLV